MKVRLFADRAHWGREEATQLRHGPQQWEWWRPCSLSVVRLSYTPPTTGKRLWIYTRWGALFFDLVFDRRP